ncbi:MAG: hypothetical protein KDB14_20180 [Planctomycetales bacterium]|nr:hypothetical protein [Planctomycetales bacterium]
MGDLPLILTLVGISALVAIWRRLRPTPVAKLWSYGHEHLARSQVEKAMEMFRAVELRIDEFPYPGHMRVVIHHDMMNALALQLEWEAVDEHASRVMAALHELHVSEPSWQRPLSGWQVLDARDGDAPDWWTPENRLGWHIGSLAGQAFARRQLDLPSAQEPLAEVTRIAESCHDDFTAMVATAILTTLAEVACPYEYFDWAETYSQLAWRVADRVPRHQGDELTEFKKDLAQLRWQCNDFEGLKRLTDELSETTAGSEDSEVLVLQAHLATLRGNDAEAMRLLVRAAEQEQSGSTPLAHSQLPGLDLHAASLLSNHGHYLHMHSLLTNTYRELGGRADVAWSFRFGLRCALAGSLSMFGKFDQAEALLESVMKMAMKYPQLSRPLATARRVEAICYWNQGATLMAQQAVNNAIELLTATGQQEQYLFLLAAMLAEDDPHEAEDWLAKARALSPPAPYDREFAWQFGSIEATVLWKRGRLQEAERLLLDVLAEEERSLQEPLPVSGWFARYDVSDSGDATYSLARLEWLLGRVCADGERWAEAADWLRRALATNARCGQPPDHPRRRPMLQELANVLRKLGDADELAMCESELAKFAPQPKPSINSTDNPYRSA